MTKDISQIIEALKIKPGENFTLSISLHVRGIGTSLTTQILYHIKDSFGYEFFGDDFEDALNKYQTSRGF